MNMDWAVHELNAGRRIRGKSWPSHCLFIRMDGGGHAAYGPEINFYREINHHRSTWHSFNWQPKDIFWTEWEPAK